MAFKFKTKKRPSATQAFAGGFAQGVSSGIQQAAQLSLQDRLNKKKEFEDFTKGLPQLINLAGLEGNDYEAARDAQFMVRRGDIKSRDAFTSFLDGKSPGLSNRLLGATEPKIIGSPYTGYAEVRRRAGKTEVTPIIEAVEKSDEGVTPAEKRDLGLFPFTEEDKKRLEKAQSSLTKATNTLDTIRTKVLTGTAVDTVDDVDPYSQYLR